MRNIFKQSKTIESKMTVSLDRARRTVESCPMQGRKRPPAGFRPLRQVRTMYLNPLIAASNRCVAALPNYGDTEAYKVIRTHIFQMGAGG